MLQQREVDQRRLVVRPAHLGRRAQADADRRALGAAKQLTPVVVGQLCTAHTGRLASRHARDGRGDRRRDTTRAAAYPAFHTAAPALSSVPARQASAAPTYAVISGCAWPLKAERSG